MRPSHRHRRWTSLSAVALTAATATLIGLIPATTAAADGRATARKADRVSPSPKGVTKAPASNAIGTPGAKRPLLAEGIQGSSFQGLGIGQVPWSEFHKERISDSVSAQVNVGNGNLLVSLAAFDIADAGPGLSLGNAYNGLNTSWKATTGSDYLVHEPTPDAVFVQGPSSTIAVFERDGSGFKPAPGYKQDLTEASDKKSFTLTSRSNGQKTTFTRSGTSGDARVSKVEDKNGNATKVTYSGAFTSKITSVSGRTLTFDNDGDHVTGVTDNDGREVSYDYDGDDMTAFTDTAGKTTRFAYDGSHRLTRVTTPEGRETRFTWDTNRVASVTRVVDKTQGTGATTAFRWVLPQPGSDAEGVVRVTDPRGHHTLKTVDSRWRVRKSEDPLGHERSKSWGPDNNVLTAVDAMGGDSGEGNVVSFDYDDAFNPTSAKQPTGAQASMSWVKKSGGYYPETLTSASDEKTENAYDTSGNMLSQADASSGGTGAKWDYTYNPEDGDRDCGGLPGQRCSATDPRGKKTTFEHDADGNLTKVTPPSPQKPTTYTYDDLGRTATATDGRGVKTTYEYDDRDRVTSQQAGSSTATSGYDDDGNMVRRQTPAGVSTFGYDEQNRERTRTLPAGGTSSVTYDAAGNVATATDGGGTTEYAYDDANQLTVLTEPGGAKTSYDYDDNGKRTKTTYPGGTTQSVTLDDSSRVTKIVAKHGTDTLSSLSYDYAKSGKDTDKIRKRTADGADTAYSYDTLGRLTKAVETKDGKNTAGWSYCYDKAGNRTGSSTGTSLPESCADAETDYDYNDAGELTTLNGDSAFSYDGAGNETAAASPTGPRIKGTWSPFTQLTSVTSGGDSSANTYAGVDNNQRLTRDGTTFTHSAAGVTTQSGTGGTTRFVREPSGTLHSMRSGGTSQYYLTDVQGSVIGLVDSSGKRTATYSYGPYGEQRTAEGTDQPYRYTGTYLDPTGLYKMGHRYYDPNLGRFTQPDPSGQEANAYLYAAGDPINKSDPTGLANSPLEYVNFALGTVGAAAGIVGLVATSPIVVGVAAGVGAAIGITLFVEGAVCLFAEAC